MNNERRDTTRNDATEDDEFGDFEGADAEDDAPESFQAIAGPSPSPAPSPWAIFPDLLRVQSNHTSTIEEPESSSSNYHTPMSRVVRHHPESSSQSSVIRGAISRETGAIPKQRVLDPPDVSLLTSLQPKVPSTLDLCSSVAKPRDSSIVSPPDAPALSRQSNLLMASDKNSCDASRATQLERDLKASQTQRAVLQQQLLQKDTQIRELQSYARHTVPNVASEPIAALTEMFEKFRTNVEVSFKNIEERINSLELKLPMIVSSAMQNSVSPQSINGDDNLKTAVAVHSDNDLKDLIDQQKRELSHERRMFLLTFSDILRKTSESLQNNCDNINGPKS